MSKLRTLFGWSHYNAHTAQKDVEDLVRLFKICVHTTIGHNTQLNAIKTHVEVVRARGDDQVYLTMMDVDAMIKMIRLSSNQ